MSLNDLLAMQGFDLPSLLFGGDMLPLQRRGGGSRRRRGGGQRGGGTQQQGSSGTLTPFDLDVIGGAGTPTTSTMNTAFAPAVDCIDKDDCYLVLVDLPGVSKQHINVNISRGSLVVSGEKQDPFMSEDLEYEIAERPWGTFRRVVPLPNDARHDQIDATLLGDGVLQIKVPKTEEAIQAGRRRAIEIKGHGAPQQEQPSSVPVHQQGEGHQQQQQQQPSSSGQAIQQQDQQLSGQGVQQQQEKQHDMRQQPEA